MVDTIVFVISAIICLTGAIGVIAAKNPVHSALMLVMTLFGIAVLPWRAKPLRKW
jgi:NADH-quinone oxidoreductase subunit J